MTHKKVIFNKITAWVLAVMMCFAAAMFVSAPAQAAAADFTVAGLKTNGQVNPIGIDEGPAFSWMMESQAIGKSQTAYRIEVASDSGFAGIVWDSGKTAGDTSTGIPYAGSALSASTAYSWRVTVWDEGGTAVMSAPASFETGLLGDTATAWSGSSWIGLGAPDVHYTVEADLTIVRQAVGIVFNYTDSTHFLMWQLNILDSEAGAGNVTLRPHVWNGGGATTGAQPVLSSMPGLNLTRADMTGAGVHMKIDVTSAQIKTYITKIGTTDEVLVDTRPFSSTGLTAKLTQIGVRSNYTNSSNYEDGTVDNLKLTDYSSNLSGSVVYFYDFENGNPFPNGSVSGGVLHTYNMGVSIASPNWQDNANVHYVVEADVAVTNNAVGLAFNERDTSNFLMWQLNTNPTEMLNGHPTLRPHRWLSGGAAVISGAAVDLYNIPGLNLTVADLSTAGVHMKIDVTNSAINTYITKAGGSETLVSTINFSATGQTAYASQIGIRVSGAEAGSVANYKMTDYSSNPQGVLVYNYDFSQGNPFLSGSVLGGRLQVYGMGLSFPFRPDLASSPYPTFRKKVDIGANVEWARLYLTGLGSVSMYINGSRVGTKAGDGVIYDELLPGYTNPAGASARVNYYTYDVTGWLKTGQNLISALVTSGWYGSRISSGTGRTLEMRAKLLVKYAGNPAPAVIGTDAGWLSSRASGVMTADIYDGETFNANIANDWRDSAAYDDSSWSASAVKSDWNGLINAVPGARVQLRNDLTRTDYTAVTYNGATGADASRFGKINVTGSYAPGQAFVLAAGEKAVIDFKQNFAGWPEITASGDKGTVITMRVGEMLNDNSGLISRGNDGPEGSVYKANYRSALSMGIYVMNGQGDETYHSTQTFYGFRYLEISASAPITVKGARGLVLTSAQADAGSITTSDPDVNKLISNARWGGYSNLLSTATDCPQRDERQGWTADTQVYTTTALYNFDTKDFYEKFMDDMRDCTDTTGAFANTVPWVGYGGGYGQLGWADAGVIIPYNVYKMTGDKTILTQNWGAMKKYMDVYMAGTNKNGGGHSFGDWLAYESNDDVIKNICGVAYYAWDALMMVDMANALGYAADAARYQQVYLDEKAYFQQMYVNADGSLSRPEQTACLMALAFDLLPGATSKETVKQQLLSNIQSHGDKLQTGFLGTALIMRTLSNIGSTDVAYRLLLQRGNPSWFYSIDQGATTMWERWNSYTKESGFGDVGMNSFNHYAYGSVAEWLYGYMCGIMYDIARPGFKHIILKPAPEQLIQSADASYESPYGTIKSAWRYTGGAFIYDAKIPANTTASVILPLEAGASYTVNGVPAASLTLAADGIAYRGTDADGNALFDAASGDYQFKTAVTELSYITIGVNNPQVQIRSLLVNGQPAGLSTRIAVPAGQPVTIAAEPYNDVDYRFDSWSGDIDSRQDPLVFTPEGNMNLTLNWAWNGWNSLAIGKTVYSPYTYLVTGTYNWSEPDLTDGVLTSENSSMGWTSVTGGSTTPAVPPWVRIDLGAVTAFNRIHLYPRTDMVNANGQTPNFPISYAIDAADDVNGPWTIVSRGDLSAPPLKKPLVIILPQTVQARYVRITANKLSQKADAGDSYYFQLAEAGIYNAAPGYSLSLGSSAGSVTATLVNNTSGAGGANLIIGAYKDGKLVRVLSSAVNVLSAGSARVTLDTSGEDLAGCNFKAFAWDPLTFAPLCEPSAF